MTVVSVVGIDLSLASTGLARISSDGKLSVSNVRTSGRNDEPLTVSAPRIVAVANEILDYIHSVPDVDLVVIEAPSHGSKFGKPHERSGCWWLVVTVLIDEGYRVAKVAPMTRAVFATGDGRSKKEVVLAHVRENYTDILGKRIANDDIADAIVLADMGAHREGYPLPTVVRGSERHVRALDSVLWPASV